MISQDDDVYNKLDITLNTLFLHSEDEMKGGGKFTDLG